MAMMVGIINTKPYSSTASDAMIAPRKKYTTTLLHGHGHIDGYDGWFHQYSSTALDAMIAPRKCTPLH